MLSRRNSMKLRMKRKNFWYR